MRKTIFLFVVCFILISCSKDIEDRLMGSWKLTSVWKRSGITGRETINTGYENSVLHFLSGDNAFLVNGTDTLTGFYHTDWTTTSTGETSTTQRTLKITVINFQRNKWLEWEFDNFDFRDNKQTIRAQDRRSGKDWYYEFVRQ